VLDAWGRVLVGHLRGITAVDTRSRRILWEFDQGEETRGVALFGGRAVWGDVSPFQSLYCFDVGSGTELWRVAARASVFSAPVIDPAGVISINDQAGNVYARSVADGHEVWTVALPDSSFSSPTHGGNGFLLASSGSNLARLDSGTGAVDWTFATSRELFGIAVLSGNRIYLGSDDRNLYCIDAETREEVWRFETGAINRGSVALGHNGTIYVGIASAGVLYAVSSSGTREWYFLTGGPVLNAPIVGGDGTIYVCARRNSPERGFVHAVNPDGSELWTMELDHKVTASPMLAPDGTLYVVGEDKNLYAFRDVAGDLDHDGDIDLADLAALGDCMTGPRIWGTRALTPPGCELLDFDRDWDVDVADFARAQIELSAP
jgi:outer membrane protein assembly factor BamB